MRSLILTTRNSIGLALILAFTLTHIQCGTATPTIPGTNNPDDSNNPNNSGDSSGSNSASYACAHDYASTLDLVAKGGTGDTVQINLNGDSISASGSGVTVDGSTATITASGTYLIAGTLNDGQIIVDSADSGTVEIILNGVDISNSSSACVNVVNAEFVSIVLSDQTDNYLFDADTYVYEQADQDEPSGALFSDESMAISGNGSLTVYANYNDAIVSKDELLILGGNITVVSADDGIRGKDYLFIKDGLIKVTAEGDGLKSDNDEDTALGYIEIAGGTLQVNAGGDGLTAETSVYISGGTFTLNTGGGHNENISSDLSAKGIKGVVNVTINGGKFNMDCADDAIHSNNTIAIDDGVFTIATGDDAIHADLVMEINGGTITVTDAYEGIESEEITINDGVFDLTCSDDGINVAGGDSSGDFFHQPWQQGQSNYNLHINGGNIAINSKGDGIDANGSITITAGKVLIDGPTSDADSAIDYDGSFSISGGFIVATGSSQMAQAPGSTSSQRSVNISYNQQQSAGTMIHLENSSGTGLFTFVPTKTYRSCVFSSPDLQSGITCSLYQGGSSTGSVTNGLYEGGTYSPGTLYQTFTLNSTVTNVGSGAGGNTPPDSPWNHW